MRLESKIGKIDNTPEKVFNFLADFNNFKNLIPPDKVQNWHSDESTCSFSVSPVGQVGIKILEKEPNKLIKLTNLEETKFAFTFWMQLKEALDGGTHIKLTMDVELNKMMEMMAKKPLQEFLDKLIDQLEKYDYQ